MLQEFIAGQVSAFLLIFMRFGMALMVMPGIGDGFVSPQIRLSFALGMSFVLTPFLAQSLPVLPTQGFAMLILLLSEAFIGLFIGTVMRLMMSALDTTGTVISIQAGFANAQVFNPVTATQGSLAGSLFTILGVTLLFVTNMHHYMLAAVVDSYHAFPATGHFMDAQDAYQTIARIVTLAFKIGVQISMPFLVVGLMVQIGLGVLGRLMPQIQIFFLAMPVQIWLSLVVLTMMLSAGLLFWINGFENAVSGALGP